MNETWKTPLNMQDQPKISRVRYYLFECLTIDGVYEIHAESLPAAIEVARIRCQNLGVAGFTVYQV